MHKAIVRQDSLKILVKERVKERGERFTGKRPWKVKALADLRRRQGHCIDLNVFSWKIDGKGEFDLFLTRVTRQVRSRYEQKGMFEVSMYNTQAGDKL